MTFKFKIDPKTKMEIEKDMAEIDANKPEDKPKGPDKFVDCPDCEGTGLTAEKQLCPTCKGSGKTLGVLG